MDLLVVVVVVSASALEVDLLVGGTTVVVSVKVAHSSGTRSGCLVNQIANQIYNK